MTPQIFHGFSSSLSLTHSPSRDRIAPSEKPKQTFFDRKEKSLRENKLIKIVSWISLHRSGRWMRKNLAVKLRESWRRNLSERWGAGGEKTRGKSGINCWKFIFGFARKNLSHQKVARRKWLANAFTQISLLALPESFKRVIKIMCNLCFSVICDACCHKLNFKQSRESFDRKLSKANHEGRLKV